MVAAAALIPRRPGSWNLPARFWIFATLKPFFREYASSTYPIAPSVRETTPASPDEPLPPMPVRKLGCVPTPTLVLNSLLTLER